MNHGELCQAYVLHRRAYRETSLLVEVLTRDFGRLGLVAKGARKRRSRSGVSRAHFEPFQPILISWSGRGDLYNLTRIEPDGGAVPLSGNPLVAGLYLNELLLALLRRHDAHPEVFAAYAMALAALRDSQTLEADLRLFEKRLLDFLGYGLELTQCATDGSAIHPDQQYAYRLDHGPVVSGNAEFGDIEVAGSTLLALARESELDANGLKQSKRLLRAALKSQLGDKPIYARELWRR